MLDSFPLRGVEEVLCEDCVNYVDYVLSYFVHWAGVFCAGFLLYLLFLTAQPLQGVCLVCFVLYTGHY